MLTATQVLEALMNEVARNNGLISIDGEDYGFVREGEGWALYKDHEEGSLPDTETRQTVTLTLGVERPHSLF